MRRSDDATIPYYSFSRNCRQLKLKNDYIAGLGDTVDLAIIGGRRDARGEQELGLGKLAWTFLLSRLYGKQRRRASQLSSSRHLFWCLLSSKVVYLPIRRLCASSRTMIEGAGEMRTLPPVRTYRDRSALLPGCSCWPVSQDAPCLCAVESIAGCRRAEKNMQNLRCLGTGLSRTPASRSHHPEGRFG